MYARLSVAVSRLRDRWQSAAASTGRRDGGERGPDRRAGRSHHRALHIGGQRQRDARLAAAKMQKSVLDISAW